MPMVDATAYAVEHIPAPRGAEWVHYALGPLYVRPPLAVGVAEDAAVPARVNRGRWIVDCPDCLNAQLACRADHRFLCNECGNVAVGNLWRPVVWPDDAEKIEALLAIRPRENQNWEPGEFRELLAIENLEHTGKVK